MPLAREALALIEQFEGYHKKLPDGRVAPYLCPARVWTIGIGSTFYEDGEPVRGTNPPITHDRAYELLGFELRQCEASVSRLTTRRLPPLAFGALVSFAYNCGSGAYRGSTLRRKVNAGDDQAAAFEFRKWRFAAGQVLRGLERRRLAEAALYLEGVRDALGPVHGGGAVLDGWAAAVRHSADLVATRSRGDDARAPERERTPGAAAVGVDTTGRSSRDTAYPTAAVAVPAQPVARRSGDRPRTARPVWLGWLTGGRAGAGPRTQSPLASAGDAGV